ncbi:MAG: hypothetical protein KF729_09280 [Sandaracinaceae bacterium]|nr:hypothetical protein [Sandaracinaceae bacterium]
MERRHIIFGAIVLGVLVAGLVGYGACMMEVGDESGSLGEVPPMPDASMPSLPPTLDDPPVEEAAIGRPPHVPTPTPTNPDMPRPDPGEPGEVTVDLPADPPLGQAELGEGRLAGPTTCGAVECGADEYCCVREGQCYARTCRDCCSEEGQPRPGPTTAPIPDPRAR